MLLPLVRAEIRAIVRPMCVPNTHGAPNLLRLVTPKATGAGEVLFGCVRAEFVKVTKVTEAVVPVVARDANGDGEHARGGGVCDGLGGGALVDADENGGVV